MYDQRNKYSLVTGRKRWAFSCLHLSKRVDMFYPIATLYTVALTTY